jgi:hypothetical protein
MLGFSPTFRSALEKHTEQDTPIITDYASRLKYDTIRLP